MHGPGSGPEDSKVYMWTYEDLSRLTPDAFERLVADLWRAMGYTVQLTGGPGDEGVDLVAVMDRGVRFTTYIQAKCYGPANKVGVREIREYSSLLTRRQADSVVVVCSSGFTEPALAEAKELKVRTIDGPELLRLLNQYNIPIPSSSATFPALSVPMTSSDLPESKTTTAEDQKPRGSGFGALLGLVFTLGIIGMLVDISKGEVPLLTAPLFIALGALVGAFGWTLADLERRSREGSLKTWYWYSFGLVGLSLVGLLISGVVAVVKGSASVGALFGSLGVSIGTLVALGSTGEVLKLNPKAGGPRSGQTNGGDAA